MSTDSLMTKFYELRFTAEEQDVVYASSDFVNVPTEDQYDKSTVYFSSIIPASDRDHISTILHIREVHDPGIYLGVPLAVGINKTAALGFVRDKVNSRISSWNKILLSFGGREIFIKAIAQSFPQYVMSCYLLPQNLIDDMS
ncbi:hypothetical protein V6N11_071626 [Hibiscus sabdariffa]|uniref:Uncharacterized protein n=1 Tax=Hibiscus sabdariffa TaxID=183260 RepID=A0ABR2U101_9ROSI